MPAALLALVAVHYALTRQWQSLAIGLGYLANCLAVVVVAVGALRRGERGIGLRALLTTGRDDALAREFPHAARETWLLTMSVVVPYLLALLAAVDALDHHDAARDRA